jgi:putative SOS response-associated peptidase YedK
MCSRYAMTSPPQAVREAFAHHNETDYPPRYDIRPTEPVLIVRLDHARRREITLVRWGLIPSWSKEPGKYGTIFNARAETALEKPSFRGPMRHRRCLVPADGYYEWSGIKGARKPHRIQPIGGGPIAFAGLWDHWFGADGSELETMAILTIEASADVSGLNDRMPIVLAPRDYESWLDVSSGQSGEAARLMRPAPTGTFEILQVASNFDGHRKEPPET